MRFVIAMMQHETNTFSPQPTPYEAFAGATGFELPPQNEDAIAAYKKSGFAIDAFLDLATEAGVEISVPIAANAEPSGPVANEAFELIVAQICRAVKVGCDAVLLDLHGAMVTENYTDGEGELLRRIREIDANVPIAVALDMHTNMTNEMVKHATIITGYRTNPHIDMYETGIRAGRTLLRTLAGEVRPKMIWGSKPMITHLLKQSSQQQPMKGIMTIAQDAEASGEVLNASVFSGFALADIPHVSFSALLVTDGVDEQAQNVLEHLLDEVWQHRQDFVFNAEPMSQSIAYAKELNQYPVVLADHGDNCGAGGNADSMAVIREVIDQGLTQVAAGPIWDAHSAGQMIKAGIDAEITVDIGGKTDVPALGLKGKPLRLSGRVIAVTDGCFQLTGPMMQGFQVNIGPTAVLDTGDIELVVSSKRCESYDLTYLTHAGIDLTSKKYILINSRLHFRAAFEPIAKHIVSVAGPGVCSSDYGQFPFQNLKRPIYPLDEF